MAKGSEMNGDDKDLRREMTHTWGIGIDQPFVLLLRVTQSSGKPLPTDGFTGRASHKCYIKLLGCFPKKW